ncbi:MAG: SMP-30/gluconolactonase/LRE family protein, partial [Pseudomonadales bacterium]|nr:SMP-30/gluconolactonase/LRE family protein [Pseudomonadales bacterium]
MSIETRDPRFLDIVSEELELELLADGLGFTEGPIWHPTEKHLTFSDIPGNRIHRWQVRGSGLEVVREPSNMANGNTYDLSGRMLTCEHATSRVTRTEADGSVTVLAAHYDGKELNSPNDIVVRKDGKVYFTDPTYGRFGRHGIEREQELDFQGV